LSGRQGDCDPKVIDPESVFQEKGARPFVLRSPVDLDSFLFGDQLRPLSIQAVDKVAATRTRLDTGQGPFQKAVVIQEFQP
jgi:hypothetical protein